MSLIGHLFRSFVDPRQDQSIPRQSIDQSHNQSINDLHEHIMSDYENEIKLPPAYEQVRRSSEPVRNHHSNYHSYNQSFNESNNQPNNQFNQQSNNQLGQSRSFIVIDEDDAEDNFSVMLEERHPNNQSFSQSFDQSFNQSMDQSFDEIDLSEILDLGYTVRQALFAVNMFRDNQSNSQSFDPELEHTMLINQAINYLIDLDDFPDVLEAQIVQMEVEQERERWQSMNQPNNQLNNRPRSVLGRMFPRLHSLSRNISAALSGSPSPPPDPSVQAIYQMVHSPQSPTLQRSVSSPLISQSHSDQSIQSIASSLNQSMDMDDSPLSTDLPFIQPDIPSSFYRSWSCLSCTFVNEATDYSNDSDQSNNQSNNPDISISDLLACSACGSSRPLTIDQSEYHNSLRDCSICLATYHSSYFPPCPPCSHDQFCFGCLHDYVSTKVFDQGNYLSIKCLINDCARPLTENEICAVLSPYDYARYVRFKRSAELSLDPRVRYCVNARCQNVLFGQAMAPRMRCDKCTTETCFNCQMKWHDGLTCAQVQQVVSASGALGVSGGAESEIAFLQYLSQSNNGQTRYRQCPGCRCWLERAAGCAKMTCRCGANFCFVCGSINANCGCTPRFHVFYPLHMVLGNWGGTGPD